MATLHNLTDADLYCPQLHVLVRAAGSVEIGDEDAGRVNTASGVWRVDAATRKQATRGAKTAEVTGAPVMEKRG